MGAKLSCWDWVHVDHCNGGGDLLTWPVQDDEGREVAIKIDRLDSKKFSAETATKSYIEVSTDIIYTHPMQTTPHASYTL